MDLYEHVLISYVERARLALAHFRERQKHAGLSEPVPLES
jgi:hypothetical protein